jgi:hypothetical protein
VSAYSSWGAATGIGELNTGTYWLAAGGNGYGDSGYNGTFYYGRGVNTGGGSGIQGNGNSGVVIVRYLKTAV